MIEIKDYDLSDCVGSSSGITTTNIIKRLNDIMENWEISGDVNNIYFKYKNTQNYILWAITKLYIYDNTKSICKVSLVTSTSASTLSFRDIKLVRTISLDDINIYLLGVNDSQNKVIFIDFIDNNKDYSLIHAQYNNTYYESRILNVSEEVSKLLYLQSDFTIGNNMYNSVVLPIFLQPKFVDQGSPFITKLRIVYGNYIASLPFGSIIETDTGHHFVKLFTLTMNTISVCFPID